MIACGMFRMALRDAYRPAAPDPLTKGGVRMEPPISLRLDIRAAQVST